MTSDFRDFIEKLEKEGELHRVKEEVEPNLEITEIAIKAQKENKPALLFENVRGSRYPLAINSFASAKRIRIALGQEPEEIGVELLNFVESLKPPSLKNIFTHRKTVKRLLSFRPTKTRKSPVHEESSESLGELPILKCWPDDGGNFITLPLVQTKDLITGIPNLGIYRMQIHDHLSTGMHMQIGKGGGYHYWEAEKQSKELPVAVTLGGDPVLTIAAIMALPEGIGELEFAGIVRGSKTKLSRCKTIDMYAPSTGEFLLEGVLKPNQRKLEGPFGDHFGHYSAAGNYPVFNINKIFHRKNPIYPATVVGKPPQEDKYLGDCTQNILKPLIRIIHPEVKDIWAYFEAGFHSLLVVATENRYTREAIKTSLSILGLGQLSLTKVLIMVDEGVNVKSKSEVLDAIKRNFSLETSMMIISKAPSDTLDFTAEKIHQGNKLVIDATTKAESNRPLAKVLPKDLKALDNRILDWKLIRGFLLVVKVKKGGSGVIKNLISNPLMSSIKLIVCVSEDIDLDDDTEVMWGIFTRFDPGADMFFTNQKFNGATPVYEGTVGIDATWKGGYEKPLTMDDKIIHKVEEKWDQYWK
ncbi:MAG: UbiD family decarboxylase [Chloroflexota bacterium]